MNTRIRLKVSHRSLKPKKPPTAKEHDEWFRRIGCTDNLSGDATRVRVTKKRKRKG